MRVWGAGRVVWGSRKAKVWAGLLAFAALGLPSREARADACFPACREGFVCAKDKCVSACNPPCGSGLSCQSGDCAPAKRAPAPVSSAPVSSAKSGAEPAEVSAPNPGARLHNGFYLRIALGGGIARQSYSVAFQSGTVSDAVYGGAFGTSFLLGGTVAHGLVIGGGAENSILASTSGGDPRVVGRGTPTFSFNVYGPFADYYFDPRAGLHAQLMVGVGLRNRLDGVDRAEGGPAFVAGVGRDWWVSEEWSIGVLGRLQGYRHGEDTGDTVTYLVPGVLASFTYH